VDAATLRRAIAETGVTTPIYHVEEMEDGSFVLHLPWSVVIWSPNSQPTTPNPQPPTPQPPTPTQDDFTAIPYVGKEIAQALRNAGLTTFDDLVKASDLTLLDIPHIHTSTLNKIRTYLKEHYL